MTYAQQINQEQEALETEPKLKLVHKYLPETEIYLSYKYRIKNRRHVLKKLQRAGVVIKAQKTDKTRKLHPKATLIAETILNKISYNGEEEVILTHKYLNKTTDCLADQNKRHIEQLTNLFDAKYERAYLKDGKFYEYCYVFKLNPAITEELKEAGVLESEFIPAKKPRSINNKNISNEIKIRSRANPSSNSNLNSSNKTSSSDTKKEQVELTNKTEAVVEQQQVKSSRPANARQKATKAQRKARIYQLPPQFDKPKTLAEMGPITEKECTILQFKSGREFTLNAQNQILQDMAKRLTRTFNSRWQFICYFSDCLRYEKRDAVQCSGNNFYIKANVTEENVLHNQQEKYLEETEQISIRQPTPSHQFRAKLANTLEPNIAYNLLLAMQNTSEVKNTLVISLNRQIELTENEQDVVLAQAQAVFNSSGISEDNQTIEKIQFMTGNQRFLGSIKKENNNRVSSVYNKVCSNSSSPVASSFYTDIENKSESAETHRLELPKSNWGEVCAAFISEYGYELYKHWLESLSIEQTATTIELSTSSDMVRDRIEQNYMPFLSEVAQSTGINKIILI